MADNVVSLKEKKLSDCKGGQAGLWAEGYEVTRVYCLPLSKVANPNLKKTPTKELPGGAHPTGEGQSGGVG